MPRRPDPRWSDEKPGRYDDPSDGLDREALAQRNASIFLSNGIEPARVAASSPT